jgi:sulfoxide reductase heme-binding subunit YedZ
MSEALWYVGRGTGLVALTLFTVVLVLGIATRSGRPVAGLPRFAVSALHRNASLLGLGLLIVHIGSLLFDPYAQLNVINYVIPFTSTYRPFWVGMGAIALDLLIVIVATSLLRQKIGPRVWKVLHWLSYAMWPVAVLHGLGSGTDAGSLWMDAWVALCGLAVLAAVVWRFEPSFTEISQLGRKKTT